MIFPPNISIILSYHAVRYFNTLPISGVPILAPVSNPQTGDTVSGTWGFILSAIMVVAIGIFVTMKKKILNK